MKIEVFDNAMKKFIERQLTSEPQTIFTDGKEAFIKMEGAERTGRGFNVEVHLDDKVFIGTVVFKDIEVEINTVETRQEWEARQDKEAK